MVLAFWLVTLVVAGGLVSITQPRTKYWILGWIPFLLLCSWVTSALLGYLDFFTPGCIDSPAAMNVMINIFVLLPMTILGYLILAIFSFMAPKGNADVSKSHCVKCGYNLKGLPEPRCPECGTPFGPKAVEVSSRRAGRSPDSSGR